MELPFWLVFLAVVPPICLGIWYVIRADKLNRYQALALVVAFIYGMTVELLALHTTHDYDYANLWLMVGKRPDWVPVTIGVCWASIMYVVMRTSDALELPWWQRPFFDGAAAMTLDLMLDPVMSATKWVANSNLPCMDAAGKLTGGLNLWTWCVTPASHTPLWFTVPVSNFLGWSAVIFMFSMMVRIGHHYLNPDAKSAAVQFVMLIVLAAIALGGCALIGPIEIHLASGPNWIAHAALAGVVAVPFLLVLLQRKTLNFQNPFPAWRLAWPAYAYISWGGLFFIMQIDVESWPYAALVMIGTMLTGTVMYLLPYYSTITGRSKAPAPLPAPSAQWE